MKIVLYIITALLGGILGGWMAESAEAQQPRPFTAYRSGKVMCVYVANAGGMVDIEVIQLAEWLSC